MAGVILVSILAFFNVTAPGFYLVFAGLLFPVMLSMHLHTLSQQGVVALKAEVSEWLVYVNGIPVRENRRSLTNPGFYRTAHLRRFLLLAFASKAAIQSSALTGTLMQIDLLPAAMLPLWAIAAGWLGWTLSLSLRALYRLLTQRWRVHKEASAGGSAWFYGFFQHKARAIPVLEWLLRL